MYHFSYLTWPPTKTFLLIKGLYCPAQSPQIMICEPLILTAVSQAAFDCVSARQRLSHAQHPRSYRWEINCLISAWCLPFSK
jgi:hypothetical protein